MGEIDFSITEHTQNHFSDSKTVVTLLGQNVLFSKVTLGLHDK